MKALEGGYKFNGAENGMAVLKQAGGHPAYNRRIRQELEDFARRNPKATASEAAEALRRIAERERKQISRLNDEVRNQ